MPYLVNNQGKMELVSDQNYQFWVDRGWQQPTPERMAAHEKAEDERLQREKYESSGQILKTAVEGGLRGLTFGASDWVEKQILDNGEEIRRREESNPGTAFASEAAGMILPALIPGGAEAEAIAAAARATKAAEAAKLIGGAAEAANAARTAQEATRAAEALTALNATKDAGGFRGAAAASYDALKSALGYTPAGFASRAERATVEGVLDALPKTSGLIGRTMERALAEGMGQVPMSLEMAVGQTLHENVIGNPDYTAEALLANPGRVATDAGEMLVFNSLLSSTISGGASAFGKLGEKALNSVTSNRVRGNLEALQAGAYLKSTGASTSDIRKLMRQKGMDGAHQVAMEARELGIFVHPGVDSAEGIIERAEAIKESSGSQIGSLLESADAHYAGLRKVPWHDQGAGITQWAKIKSQFEEPIMNALLSEGTTVPVAKDFAKVLADFDVAYLGKDLDLAGLNRLKSDIGEFLYKNKKVIDPFDKAVGEPVERMMHHVSELVEAGVRDSLGKDGVAALKGLNRKYEVAATIKELTERGMENSRASLDVFANGPIFGMIGHGIGGTAGMAASLAIRALYESRGPSIVAWASGALKEALEPKAAMLGALSKNNDLFRTGILADMKTVFTNPARALSASKAVVTTSLVREDRTREQRIEDYRKKAQEIRVAASPAVLLDRVAQIGDAMRDHAPQTSTSAMLAASRAIQFLGSKLPTPPEPSQTSLLANDFREQPSPREIEKFDRYYRAVLDPRSILKSAAGGHLTAEEVEAVKSVYPRIFESMQSAALEGMINSKGHVPRSVKNSMDLLMGNAPPRNAAAIQGVYAKLASQANAKQPQPGTKKAPENASERLSLHPSNK